MGWTFLLIILTNINIGLCWRKVSFKTKQTGPAGYKIFGITVMNLIHGWQPEACFWHMKPKITSEIYWIFKDDMVVEIILAYMLVCLLYICILIVWLLGKHTAVCQRNYQTENICEAPHKALMVTKYVKDSVSEWR